MMLLWYTWLSHRCSVVTTASFEYETRWFNANYCIVENFWGRKLSRIGEKCFVENSFELFRRLFTRAMPKDTTPPNWENFCEYPQNWNSRKFSPSKVSRYTVSVGDGTKDLRTQGPGDPRTGGPKDPESWELCYTAAVRVQIYRQSVPMLQVQTHGYVLYSVTIHTKCIIYSRQCCFKLFSDFFDPQSSLLSVLHSQTCTYKVRVLILFAYDFWPWTSACIVSHASSLACNKGDYILRFCRLKKG